jgi:molybdate transport system substrate-binding protein
MKKFTFIMITALCIASCGQKKSDLSISGSHRLDAPLTKIIAAFEAENGVTITKDFGCGGPKLIPQLKASNRGDVLILGEAEELKLANQAGLVNTSDTVAWNPFVMVVKKGNPLKVKVPGDLKNAKLNLPEPDSGCASRLSNGIVKTWGLGSAAAQAKRLDKGCKSTQGCEMVAKGESDATFTWRIVAFPVKGIEMIPIEKAKGAPCECYGILLKSAKNRELAQKFIAYLKTPKAQAIFREAGMLDLQEKGI